MLVFEALQPAGRYVVLYLRRGLVGSWVSGEPFPHLIVLPQGESGHLKGKLAAQKVFDLLDDHVAAYI